jgi:hypothetical protein
MLKSMTPLDETARTSAGLMFVILRCDMDDVGGIAELRDEVKCSLAIYSI